MYLENKTFKVTDTADRLFLYFFSAMNTYSNVILLRTEQETAQFGKKKMTMMKTNGCTMRGVSLIIIVLFHQNAPPAPDNIIYIITIYIFHSATLKDTHTHTHTRLCTCN